MFGKKFSEYIQFERWLLILIAAVFMELRQRNGLVVAFAGAGFFWLSIMLWLAFSDYTTRTNFPPA